jgi:alkylhydroperoxidase/carboxymuconolactone decarboxylase family protein YurZ
VVADGNAAVADGLSVRKSVLGDEYVERALERSTPFSLPLQDFLNEHCWGNTWLRPGLERRERSIVTLVALACGSKWQEFRTHVRGALRNGLTEDELREVLLHLAVYAGVPTAVEAFRVADEVLNPPQNA